LVSKQTNKKQIRERERKRKKENMAISNLFTCRKGKRTKPQ